MTATCAARKPMLLSLCSQPKASPSKISCASPAIARKLVRQVIRGERNDVFRTRQSSIEAYLPLLDDLWNSGCRNGATLWRRLKAKGFQGALRVVSEWATRRRRADRVSDQQLQKVPPARKIARMMTTARDHLSKADTIVVAAI